MWDKFKQLGDLNKMRQQAKQLQDELSKIIKTYENKGIRVKIRGDQMFEYIEMNGVAQPDLVEVLNDAIKDIQKEAAKKMMEMGGGISGLLNQSQRR